MVAERDKTTEVAIARIRHLQSQRPPTPFYDAGKYILDYLLGTLLLLIALAPIAIMVVVARLDSPGPAIFRQRRVGKGGRSFAFYKFRTMYVDAPTRFPELYAYNELGSTIFKASFYKPIDDPRLTRFGRFIRKTSLDELPNLLNVVMGDISLVGPRPELPAYLQYYTDRELAKFTVRAGMTGLAQVSGRNLLTVQEQIDADLEYVEHRSFWLDLKLLARTVWMVARRVGAH